MVYVLIRSFTARLGAGLAGVADVGAGGSPYERLAFRGSCRGGGVSTATTDG